MKREKGWKAKLAFDFVLSQQCLIKCNNTPLRKNTSVFCEKKIPFDFIPLISWVDHIELWRKEISRHRPKYEWKEAKVSTLLPRTFQTRTRKTSLYQIIYTSVLLVLSICFLESVTLEVMGFKFRDWQMCRHEHRHTWGCVSTHSHPRQMNEQNGKYADKWIRMEWERENQSCWQK